MIIRGLKHLDSSANFLRECHFQKLLLLSPKSHEAHWDFPPDGFPGCRVLLKGTCTLKIKFVIWKIMMRIPSCHNMRVYCFLEYEIINWKERAIKVNKGLEMETIMVTVQWTCTHTLGYVQKGCLRSIYGYMLRDASSEIALFSVKVCLWTKLRTHQGYFVYLLFTLKFNFQGTGTL